MFQNNLLKGRVVLITGGGTGLGRAMAEQFAEYGSKVVILGRRENVLKETAYRISRLNRDVLPIKCDVRFVDEIEHAFRTAIKNYGKVDFLINNAAGNFVAPTHRLSSNAFKLIIDTVLMGSINFSLIAGKHWIKENSKGVILNILTTYSNTGSAFVVPSACAKAGVENLTKSLAAEWGKFGIRVVGIAPGPFPTDGAMRQLRLEENLFPNKDIMKFAIDRIPLKRFGKLEELVNLGVFLVSPMADYITGEIIRIDGGEIPSISGEFCFLNSVTEECWDKAGGLKRPSSKKGIPHRMAIDKKQFKGTRL